MRSSAQGLARGCRKLTVYREMCKTDLEDIISDISGDFCKLMVALVKGRRADGSVMDYELTERCLGSL